MVASAVLLTPSFLGIVAVSLPPLLTADIFCFLFLKDIVMPKLDGVAATSLIRKFDQGTPIISMTSNSKPNEIMTYYNHGMLFSLLSFTTQKLTLFRKGMNDILPKPFTKEGLLDMLEVRRVGFRTTTSDLEPTLCANRNTSCTSK